MTNTIAYPDLALKTFTGQKRPLWYRIEDKRDETKIHHRHRLSGHHYAE